MFCNPEDDVLRKLLTKSHTIAVVGLSNKPERDSYRVARYLREQGYKIIPVNPLIQEAIGERAYPDLSSIPHPVDIVNIFRRSEEVPGIVESVYKFNPPPAIWMQLGVVHEEAAREAKGRGLMVVMDRCLMVEYRRLLGTGTYGENN